MWALGIHHAKAKRRSYLLMTCALCDLPDIVLRLLHIGSLHEKCLHAEGMGF